jgi:dihydrolipoamide dehydrogenase
MSENAKTFDLTVIGSGPGGYVASIRAAQLGFKTALIEKDPYIGGTCLNVGCIPSKALLHSTEQFAFLSNHAARHGIEAEGVRMNLEVLQGRRKTVVESMRNGVRQLVSGRDVEIIHGHASILGPGNIRVFQKQAPIEITSKYILIATGSYPVELPFLPFDGKHVVSSTEALAFDAVPESLIVVGGGAIGLELGSVWSRLGTKVTIVEFLPRIAAGCDADISKATERILKKQGMYILTNTKITEGNVSDGMVSLKAIKEDIELMLDASKVLVAVGRQPFTEGLGVEAEGIEMDSKGRIITDAHYQTSIPGIYAIGDVIAGPMLAHKAEEEGVALVEFLKEGYGHVNYDLIPNVIYTDPEIASVGLTEEAASEKYGAVKIGKINIGGNGRAIASGHDQGMVKIIAHGETDKILGVHIIGAQASELIASAVAHMEYGGSAEDLARTVHAHPTISESIKEAALAVDNRSIHALQPPEKG